MSKIILQNLKELSAEIPVDLTKVKFPTYGRNMDDYAVGEVFVHPRGITITKHFAIEFATQFHEANPLYLNQVYAKAHGFRDLLVSPMQVFNLALSMGVQNDSEKAVANLGYYNVKFVLPVYPEDTLRGYTKVLDLRDRGRDKPGIVTVRTVAVNQDGKTVLQYDRKIMLKWSGQKSDATTLVQKNLPEAGDDPVLEMPEIKSWPKDLTGVKTYFENFKTGDVIVHANGRTITDEHLAWTYRLLNTHPLHYDRLYTKSLSGKMSGEPIVYGGLVMAWLCGLASRDVSENALWDLGYTEGYHTQPAISGDTVAAISRVLKVEDTLPGAGVVTLQLIGVKNIRAREAFEKFGTDLFVKEGDKAGLGKEKIPEKIFEIERKLLIKKHL